MWKTLADRVHGCSSCGLVLDCDLNAAHNILRRGTVGHTGFEACEVAPRGVTVKQEAYPIHRWEHVASSLYR